ncbi:D-alanyl-D-alanine carboxypeptidase family protein [Blastochloris viridis]|uniref:D-alanyl-D-alanine carboxypeptidase dacA n=1 Tax=Blastochloris viridis TaxID=1079 RepID=A0A0S4Q945_BLAVI|nr:D-alanyl-D-alanine carboxypeptidase family protein [Blastochloris viridis]CUU43993.1 D-alanyl-D-alanine carboxypeptidase dacA precursor [Blastochloris viridis]
MPTVWFDSAVWRRGLAGLGLAVAVATQATAAPTLLVDAHSGEVLFQREAGRPWYPASVTKLMTTYVALSEMRAGHVRPETLITFSANAEAQDPSKMGFKAGTQLTLENALRMLMVKSANDVAVTIAENLGGSVEGFAAQMNAHAQRLGMTGSHFANPHGLPNPEQFTTARDMAVLARALIRDFPEAEALFRLPAIKLGKIKMRNHNGLLHRYDGADGMKTGFICASGFNVVATATRGGRRLIAVVFGGATANDRNETAAALFERGFQPSFSFFASSPPRLDQLDNVASEPGDMRDVVCGKGRKRATENDDDGPAAAASNSDPDGIYAAVRVDRPTPSQTAAARPSLLGPVVLGDAVPVYLGPARGDTLLAGIAPGGSGGAVQVAVPRRIAPTAIPVTAGVAGGRGLGSSAGAVSSPSGGNAYAPASVGATVPLPPPRPRF